MECSRTEFGSLSLTYAQQSQLTDQVKVKERIAFIAGRQAKKTGSSFSKDLNSLMTFGEGFLKATFGVKVAACGLCSDWLVAR